MNIRVLTTSVVSIIAVIMLTILITVGLPYVVGVIAGYGYWVAIALQYGDPATFKLSLHMIFWIAILVFNFKLILFFIKLLFASLRVMLSSD